MAQRVFGASDAPSCRIQVKQVSAAAAPFSVHRTFAPIEKESATSDGVVYLRDSLLALAETRDHVSLKNPGPTPTLSEHESSTGWSDLTPLLS